MTVTGQLGMPDPVTFAGAVDTLEAHLVGVPLEAWDGHDALAARLSARLISIAVELDHTSIAFHRRAVARAVTGEAL